MAVLGSGLARITKTAITVTSAVCELSNWEECRTFKTKIRRHSAAEQQKNMITPNVVFHTGQSSLAGTVVTYFFCIEYL